MRALTSSNGHAAPAPKIRRIRSRPGVGEIQAGVAYSTSEFARRLRCGRHGLAKLERMGLRIVQVSPRVRWVLGSDFLEFLQACGRPP